MRYPPDHRALFAGDRSVTLHNDCIFNGGPDGYDGGTFPADDRQTWVDYTKEVAAGNAYGGEGCNQADDSTYDWSNFDDVCGSNGLAAYIDAFQIAYFNVSPLSGTWPDFVGVIKLTSSSPGIRPRSTKCSTTRLVQTALIRSRLHLRATSKGAVGSASGPTL